MTSRHWKDQREKQAFLQQLREFRDETLLSADLDPRDTFADAVEREYREDVRDGLFDDDPWDGFDDLYYDDDEAEDWEPRESIFDCRGAWDEDEPLRDLVRPGYHVRRDGQTWLVLENGRLANLLTGEVVSGSGWVEKDRSCLGTSKWTSTARIANANGKPRVPAGTSLARSWNVQCAGVIFRSRAITSGLGAGTSVPCRSGRRISE